MARYSKQKLANHRASGCSYAVPEKKDKTIISQCPLIATAVWLYGDKIIYTCDIHEDRILEMMEDGDGLCIELISDENEVLN